MTRKYWATSETASLSGEMQQRIEAYKTGVQSNGRMDLWRRAITSYYGLDQDGTRKSAHRITFGGREGEIVNVRGNILRALVRQLLVMTTGSRPSFQCRPIAYDALTTEVVTLGNAICDRYLDESVESTLCDAVLYAITMGEGWIGSLWDDTRGPIMGQIEGRIVHPGDCEVVAMRPDQIVRDPKRDGTNHDWVIVRRQRSRWDLVAQYPEHESTILGATDDTADVSLFLTNASSAPDSSSCESDVITVWELYHKPTDAMPAGRIAYMVGGKVIADGENKYQCLPWYPLITSREPGGPYGYGESWDLLGMQSAFDSVLTQVFTTQENFGLRNVFIREGTLDTNPIDIGRGMRLLQGTEPPIPVDLGQGAVAQGAEALGLLRGLMQMLTGLNDASVGDAGKSSSGAALAMMHQLASQFNSSLQRSYSGAFEWAMGMVIKNLQMFATDERMVHIAGRNRAPLIKRFKAADLKAIDGITVEMGSAAMRSTSMRIETAKTLLSGGVLKSPEQYLEVQATGRLEPVLEGPRASEVRAERLIQMVLEGKSYTPLATDPHEECISRLVSTLDDEEMRADPATLQAITMLIQQHAQMWADMSMSPIGVTLLQATGQSPSAASQLMQAQAPMGAPPMPPNPEATEDGAGPPNVNPGPLSRPNPAAAANEAPMGPGAPNMPNLPAESQGMI